MRATLRGNRAGSAGALCRNNSQSIIAPWGFSARNSVLPNSTSAPAFLRTITWTRTPKGVLGQEQRVAEFHFGAGLLTHDHLDVRFIEAEDLLFIGYGLALQDALAGLLARLGQLLQDLVHPLKHLLGLRAGPVGSLPVLVEQLPVAPGMAAHRPDQAIHLAESLFAQPPALGLILAIPDMGHFK